MPLKKFDANTATKATPADRALVLYVEDEDPNWDIAAKRLATRYDMRRARNSDEAFAALATHRFSVILMDIQLAHSDLNGIDITRVLRGNHKGAIPAVAQPLVGKAPPIIFVTAYTARYSKEELRGHGGDDLIAKPVDFVALTGAMTRLILRSAHLSPGG